MRTFNLKCHNDLPKLAWCLFIEKQRDKIEVLHGPLVESQDNLFVEGIWDSAFEMGQFDNTELLMGSGAILYPDFLLIASPCHTLERIHTLRLTSGLFASNSLTFLLNASGSSLDLNHIQYHTDLASVLLGTQKCVKSIPTVAHGNIGLHYNCNLAVDHDLNLHVVSKPDPPDFINFHSYNDYCVSALHKLFANAMSEARKIQYSPLVAMSSGYDSAACAALARQAGCDRAVTITKLRSRGESDSGKLIAEALGYKQVREYAYETYADIGPFSEAEVFASGDLSLIRFSVFAQECVQSLLITGINGDVVWDRNNDRVGDLHRNEANLGGLSAGIAEFRLRLGFAHLPLPFFGAARHDAIYRISNADEMQPWKIGGHYDRPIPRRILEERGVNRALFGVGKRGIGIGVSYFPKRMNPESYADLLAYYKGHKKHRRGIKQFCFWIPYLTYVAIKAYNTYLRKVGFPHLALPQFIPFKYARTPGLGSFMIHWGISVISNRYASKL